MSPRTRWYAAAALLLAALPVLPGPADAASTCRGRAVTIEVRPGGPATGTPGDDVVLVAPGSQGTVQTGAGDDLVCVADGTAVTSVDGGPGTDTVVLDVTVDIEVKLDRAATWTVGGHSTEIGLGGFENAVVTGARTVVYGTKKDNKLVALSTEGALLTGKEGDDVLRLGVVPDRTNHRGLRLASGGPGDDVLRGSPRPDVLTGGTGRDKAVGNGGKDVCTAELRRGCELS